ncbi:elongation factor P [Stella humosa]|uniref:Elongation factor P n=1 Tax=Stella humosa TaxID=94 RepID=A0A3N1LJV2_9PROT|nr:elongation factor P [Stella humosa]ROP91284.1 elongation factor P [Stella humosa]BBK34361.1 elongation factor P [Stella humosa]
MKITAIEIKPGNILDHQNRLWVVLKRELIQPGKGGAFAQVEMRDIRTGNKTNERFRTQETVERIRMDEKEYQFLFAEGDTLTFMDQESYEQIVVDRAKVGDPADFLRDGMTVTIQTHEGEAMAVTLPSTVTMLLTEADPVVKGQTASSSYKPAMLENGRKILVPPFIEAGTRIVVDTTEGTYVERAKD